MILLKENYFTHNNKWFSQEDGLAMGVSLSPFLANFYMNSFIKKTKDWIQKPIMFCIFVDNCFLIWNEKSN